MRLKIPTTPHTIRFPGDLYEKIHLLAQQSGRTFNGAVVYMLQLGYAVAKRYDESVKAIMEETSDATEVNEDV